METPAKENKAPAKQTEPVQTPDTPSYNSNPFTLSFGAMGKLFEHNAGWAIAIIVLALLGFLGQISGDVINMLLDSKTAEASSLGGQVLAVGGSAGAGDAAVVVAIVIVVFVVLLVAILAGTAIGAIIQGMFSYVSLKSLEGKSVGLSEALNAAGKRFWRLFGAQLLATVKIIGWSLLLIVPGIIAALRYALLPYLIMDEDESEKGISSSHQRAKTLTKGRLMEVFGVATVSSIIPIIGSVIDIAGNGALYRQLQVYTDQNLEKPKVHWLNYLGLFLLAALFALILFIIVIIVIVASQAS